VHFHSMKYSCFEGTIIKSNDGIKINTRVWLLGNFVIGSVGLLGSKTKVGRHAKLSDAR